MPTVQSSLYIHDAEVHSIFDIVGEKENDLSYSLGYVLSKSQRLLRALITKIYKPLNFKNAVIKLQESGIHDGFTDFEITLDNKYLFIIEAKKGWILPATQQLKKYLPRFRGFKKTQKAFVVLSDCTKEYFRSEFNDSLYNVPIKSLAWADVISLIDEVYAGSSTKEKWLLHSLKEYLRGIIVMESQESNWVYVVCLANGAPSWSKILWKDVVYKRHFYFYPQGKGWPVPSNYIAFRFDGKLQTIHHVRKYEVVQDIHSYIPEIRKGKLQDHYLIWLEEGFEPRKELPTGNIWSNGRVNCMLDTLFTSKTIKEAISISKKRINK